jgi:hypothetical protein
MVSKGTKNAADAQGFSTFIRRPSRGQIFLTVCSFLASSSGFRPKNPPLRSSQEPLYQVSQAELYAESVRSNLLRIHTELLTMISSTFYSLYLSSSGIGRVSLIPFFPQCQV